MNLCPEQFTETFPRSLNGEPAAPDSLNGFHTAMEIGYFVDVRIWIKLHTVTAFVLKNPSKKAPKVLIEDL